MTLIDCLKNLFIEDDINPLSPEELRVYIDLLKSWNSSGREEWFECNLLPNVLPKPLPNVLPKMTIVRVRNKLQKRGLIQYVSGNGKTKKPYYKFEVVTNRVTNVVTKSVTNSKEKVSPTPPLKENITELREKERISKDIPKKEIDLSFCLPGFIPIMEEWLEYKKKRKESYKTEASIRKCYHNLVKLSDNNPAIAQMIVDRSIANNWAGLFELKNNGASNNKIGGQHSTDPGAVQEQPVNIYKEVFGYDGPPDKFEEWFNRNPYGG